MNNMQKMMVSLFLITACITVEHTAVSNAIAQNDQSIRGTESNSISEPTTTNLDPETTTPVPSNPTTNPETTTTEPKFTTEEPNTTTTDPKTTTAEPKTTATEPKTTESPTPVCQESSSGWNTVWCFLSGMLTAIIVMGFGYLIHRHVLQLRYGVEE